MVENTRIEGPAAPVRTRLPDRRKSVVKEFSVDGHRFTAALGFAPDSGEIKEIFLTGAKEGGGLAATLDDASVVISVALQYGVPAKALAKSVGRVPARPLAPTELGMGARVPSAPASVIGAALDLLCEEAGRQPMEE